ncbi:MAG: hypothetical protein WA632_09185 [Gallionella sp.]
MFHSGGENISFIEVEDMPYRHPALLAAAVVATPDDKRGEVTCTFIELCAAQAPSQDELTDSAGRGWRALGCPSSSCLTHWQKLPLAKSRNMFCACGPGLRRPSNKSMQIWKAL